MTRVRFAVSANVKRIADQQIIWSAHTTGDASSDRGANIHPVMAEVVNAMVAMLPPCEVGR
jgi:hypothetical protein